jgi:hypothetical protein
MPAKQNRTKRMRPNPDGNQDRHERLVLVRRKVSSLLKFWKFCGHRVCLRARACARKTNDCYEPFWRIVPEELKITIRTGMQARAEGLSGPEIQAAIERARARYRATQAPLEPETPEPPRPSAALAQPAPRVRVL